MGRSSSTDTTTHAREVGQDLAPARRLHIDVMCSNARRASQALRELDQQQVDDIVWAMARAGIEAAYPLAQLAIEETNIGTLEDKVIKNYVATEFLWDYLKDKRTVGVIADDPMTRTKRVANPIGVVLSILPLTNPTSTALFKAIVSIKTRNAMIMRGSSRAERCTQESIDVLVRAGREAGLPEHALQYLDSPTVADTQYLFEHPQVDFIWTTGGSTIVEAASRSSKPGLGVGPGNAPVYLEETADVKMAVNDIVFSKTFDGSVICPAEQTAVIDDAIYDDVLAEFQRNGCHVLTPEEVTRVTRLCFDADGNINMFVLGQPAGLIAQAAEIDAAPNTKILIAPVASIDENELMLHEKLFPVLTVMRAHSHDEALGLCEHITTVAGVGHTSAIFSKREDIIERFADRIQTGRVLVNVPTAIGSLGGTYNDLPPTFSFGCGTWGGSNTTDNLNYEHLLNIKHVSYRKTPPRWFRSPADIFYNEHAIENVAHLGAERVVLITSPGNALRGMTNVVKRYLGSATVHEFSSVGPEPTDEVVQRGVELMRQVEPDVIIALGGGSVIDAAKVMRLMYEHPDVSWRDMALPFFDIRKRIVQYPQRRDTLKLVAVPTTSGTGSEVSPAAVITDWVSKRKVTLIDYSLVPEIAIVDPQFVLSMPPTLTADGGIDALTHAVEAFVSIFAAPFTDSMCIQSMHYVLEALPEVYRDGSNMELRSLLHNTSSIAGIALSNASVGVAHSLAHALGSTFDIAHGRACGIVLPHVVRYNAEPQPTKSMPSPTYTSYVAPERYARAAQLLGLGTPGDTIDQGVHAFHAEICRVLDAVEIPRSIEAAGVTREQFDAELDRMVDLAYNDVSSRTNPRMPLLHELRELFEAAWSGRAASAD